MPSAERRDSVSVPGGPGAAPPASDAVRRLSDLLAMATPLVQGELHQRKFLERLAVRGVAREAARDLNLLDPIEAQTVVRRLAFELLRMSE